MMFCKIHVYYFIHHITSGGINQRVYRKLQLYYSLTKKWDIIEKYLNLIKKIDSYKSIPKSKFNVTV